MAYIKIEGRQGQHTKVFWIESEKHGIPIRSASLIEVGIPTDSKESTCWFVDMILEREEEPTDDMHINKLVEIYR